MKRYDLNNRNSVQVVETVLQFNEYKGHIYQVISGDCLGDYLLNFDFDSEDDDVYNDCKLELSADEMWWQAVLRNDAGVKTHFYGSAQEFSDMTVKHEIIGQFANIAEAQNFINQKLEGKNE